MFSQGTFFNPKRGANEGAHKMASYSIKSRNYLKHLDFILYDLFCTTIAFFLAYFARFGNLSDLLHVTNTSINGYLIIVLGMQIFVGARFSMYKNILKRGIFDEALSVLKLCLSATGLSIIAAFLFHFAGNMARLFIAYICIFSMILIFFERITYKKIVIKRLKNGKIELPRLFVVADVKHAEDIIRRVKAEPLFSYDLIGIAVAGEYDGNEILGVPVICKADEAADYLKNAWVDDVLIYAPAYPAPRAEFFKVCADMNIVVHNVLNIDQIERKQIAVRRIAGLMVLSTGYVKISVWQAAIKRAVDILGALVGCLCTVLIGIVIGPIIYISSPGPIIFKQTRIGRNGKKFTFYKFRSMVPNAEELKKSLMEQNNVKDGMMFKMDHDPRLIGYKKLPDGREKNGIGQFIRRTSLDEFPQFFNVLKGDMSLVGTRPPTEDEWEKYDYHHRARLTMRPGITGMWQVSGRSNITDFEEVVRLDLEYITTFSLTQDFKILLKTVFGVFKKDGAK